MKKVFCFVDERFVNPLFEVFDGGDFILSSWRDVERPQAEMRIYFDVGEPEAAQRALSSALDVVGVTAEISCADVPDEDWKFAYRRHFKAERIGRRLMTVPVWELERLENPEGREVIALDPGMAFGTGKHETTRACLEYVEALSPVETFLDMGCGSGILSIAAKKLGCGEVAGFDVDEEAVNASVENAVLNKVEVSYNRFALGRRAPLPGGKRYALVAANILGPLLIRFADEIERACAGSLIVSGILNELYPEVLEAFTSRGFREVSHRTIGEWTTGLLTR